MFEAPRAAEGGRSALAAEVRSFLSSLKWNSVLKMASSVLLGRQIVGKKRLEAEEQMVAMVLRERDRDGSSGTWTAMRAFVEGREREGEGHKAVCQEEGEDDWSLRAGDTVQRLWHERQGTWRTAELLCRDGREALRGRACWWVRYEDGEEKRSERFVIDNRILSQKEKATADHFSWILLDRKTGAGPPGKAEPEEEPPEEEEEEPTEVADVPVAALEAAEAAEAVEAAEAAEQQL